MVDVAMLDCQLAILENALTTHLVTGDEPGRLGTRHPNIAPFQAFEAGDGQPARGLRRPRRASSRALCGAIGRRELTHDARFRTADDRRRHVDALADVLGAVLRDASGGRSGSPRSRTPACRARRSTRCADAVRTPQVERRATWSSASTIRRSAGSIVAGNPIKLAGVPEPPARRAPPDLDADRGEILSWLDARSARA